MILLDTRDLCHLLSPRRTIKAREENVLPQVINDLGKNFQGTHPLGHLRVTWEKTPLPELTQVGSRLASRQYLCRCIIPPAPSAGRILHPGLAVAKEEAVGGEAGLLRAWDSQSVLLSWLCALHFRPWRVCA